MIKYRIRQDKGRVIGPFTENELFDLKSKGGIDGSEDAQVYPAGEWTPLSKFSFYEDLISGARTILNKEKEDSTFVIDLAKIRAKAQEKELEKMAPVVSIPPEELTETVRMPPAQVKVEVSKDPQELPPVELESWTQMHATPYGEKEKTIEKTIINPVAQQELERMRRNERLEEEKKKAAEEKRITEEELKKKNEALVSLPKEEPKVKDDSTQIFRLDSLKSELLLGADQEEHRIEAEWKQITKEREQEEKDDEENSEEDSNDVEKGKGKKIRLILILAAMIMGYAILFPNDEGQKNEAFKHIDPQIVFPIPFDKADTRKSKIEFEKGLETYAKGNYSNVIQSGLLFKSSYENNTEDINALSMMMRSYSEQLRFSKSKFADAQIIFKLIQANRPLLFQNPNGVIGLNLFYSSIDKVDAAVDVVARYLKLYPQNVTPDLFAVYLRSLVKNGKIDVAKPFFTALMKAPNKERYPIEAIVEYLNLNQEFEKANEFIDDAIKKYPQLVTFQLMKADYLLRQKKYAEVEKYLLNAEGQKLEHNDLYRAKYLQIKGLLWAAKGDAKKATSLLTKSLEIEDSGELRMMLADLNSVEGEESETNKLISESKAAKLLIQAKDFYEKKNYELAMSTAAKATDAHPDHIPSELFLAKMQLKLGLAEQGLKTIENLVKKYPDNREVNFELIDAYINTYKFNNAKNRISIISATPLRGDYQYASLNAKLYLRMGDSLHAISWLKGSMNMNPINDADIFILAEIMLRRNNFDAARSLLNMAMELDPVNPDYKIAYAKLVYETQDDQSAIGYLLGLLKEFGENPKYLSEIAIMYHRSGKVKDFEAYKKKLENLPNKDKSLYEFLIKSALMEERFLEVPSLVEQLIQIEPGDLENMMTAGRVLFESGKLVEAAKWFKRIQEKLSTYPKVQYYIAKIKFLSGDLDAAMEEVKKDIKDNGENDADLVLMAEILVQKDDLVEAENYFKKAQKLNPNSYEALMGMADISTRRNNYELSLDLYKKAMRVKSDEPKIHKKVGDVYRLLGQGTLAIEAYKLYLEMNPEAPDKGQIESYIQLMQ